MRIRLRDIDNRDDQMQPYEFEGPPEEVIGYLDGPLRKDVLTRKGIHAVDNAIASIQRGDIQRANKHLREVSVDLHEVQ